MNSSTSTNTLKKGYPDKVVAAPAALTSSNTRLTLEDAKRITAQPPLRKPSILKGLYLFSRALLGLNHYPRKRSKR